MPMPDNNTNTKAKPLVFYSVIYRKYDNPNDLHGRLYSARYAYLEENANVRRTIDDVCDGVDTRYTYHISKKGLKWKKVKNGKVIQRTIPEADGYGVVTTGLDGHIISNTAFNKNHQWIHNYYYKDDNIVHPYIVIEPIPGENAVNFLEYDKEYREYTKKKLLACPIELGSVVQSIVNNEVGEPEICAATSEGDFCYCSRTERNRRLSLAQAVRLQKDGTIPTWTGPDMEGVTPTKPDFDPHIDLSKYKFNFTPEQMGVDALYNMPDEIESEQDETNVLIPEESQMDVNDKQNNGKSFVDFEALLHSNLSGEELDEMEKSNQMALEESKRKLQLAKWETTDLKEALPSGQPRHPSTYLSNRELYSVGVQPQKSSASLIEAEGLQTSKQVDSMIAQVDRMIRSEGSDFYSQDYEEKPQEPKAKPSFTLVEGKGEKASSRYTVAVQKTDGKTFCTQDVLNHTVVEHQNSAIKSVSAAKRIVVSEQESYLYFGRLMNGLRQGRGRTEMENGFTAYDGHYRDDKRDGFGAYYYKSGQICYVGDWKENKREGVGVSYTPHGESIHVGKWHDDKPFGTGAIFDGDGNLSFAGKIENGLRQGAGISYQVEDGTIFVGKWKDNIPTGKGSEFDHDGNLIYTGMWRDGKRHGFGTEYDESGKIVFTGEWENDKYLDGVLYKKVEQPSKEDKIDF